MFTSITNSASALSVQSALLITLSSIVFGLAIAITYMCCKAKYTKNFVITLVALPMIVQVVIMMVNGSLGAGVAIAGAFSLIRFRSQPATSRELLSVFMAMAIGLSNAMGFITFSLLITAVFCVLLFVLDHTKFGEKGNYTRNIKITIPENLDYTTIFDDLFAKYLKNVTLDKVKTTNMGSMFELTYIAEIVDPKKEKEFIDAVRCRNGNLTVLINRPVVSGDEL